MVAMIVATVAMTSIFKKSKKYEMLQQMHQEMMSDTLKVQP